MGKVKLKIKRLESSNARQTTYAKRKNGILKKANELAILCDIDILLLMFSPTGKPSLCCGKRGIEQVITKYAQLTPQERAKRQLEALEALKKTFKKLDHDVNIQEFLGSSTQSVEGLSDQITQIRTELEETQQRLSNWSDPSKIESLEHLGQLEESLGKSLDAIRARKERLEKQKMIMTLQETSAQIQNMQMPYRASLEQNYQPLQWIAPNDGPQIPLTEDPNLIPQREIGRSEGSSFATYPSYMDLCKRAQSDVVGDDNFLSNLGRSSPLGEVVSGKYSVPSYSDNLLASNIKYLTSADTDLQNSFHHEPQTTFGDQPVFDTNFASWASTSDLFGDTIHSSQASDRGPCVDTTHNGVWGATSGLCAATTNNGSWAAPGPFPVSLFDEHYQQAAALTEAHLTQ